MSKRVGTFIKRGDFRVSFLKDFSKSQQQKREWQKSSSKFMFALKKFHHSPEGRRMHRKLGRYNATREAFKMTGGVFLNK